MKRKAILSVLLGAVTLVMVGCTNSIDNKTNNGENNAKIVEDNKSVENSDDNNKSKDDNAKEEEKEKVMQSNNKEGNKTGTSISKKEKNKDPLVESKDNKTSNKASEDNSNNEIYNNSDDEAKPKVQRYYSNNNTTNNQKDNSNVNNNTNNTNNNATNESSYMAAVESEIINIVNSERTKVGKKALSYKATMQSYGRQKSKDMAINNYFSHEDLSNRTEYDKMKANGVKINAWGENIAYMSNRSPEVLAREFMNNWMNSPGHKANILSGNFTGIGVGVYKYGDKIYATQEFCA